MANNNASLSELTVTIAKTSAALQEYLHKNNLQGPSFTDNAHVPDYLPNDEAIEDIRCQLVQAARILADLVSAPKQLFIEKTTFPVSTSPRLSGGGLHSWKPRTSNTIPGPRTMDVTDHQ